MLINKIEFLPDVASKLLLYVTPYNIIFPFNDFVNIIAVVKDAKGNTVTSWDENITFTIESINPSEDISGYLENDIGETGNIMIVNPINGIATIMLNSGEESTLDADEIGNINLSAKTSSAETGELSDNVDIKVTLGAVKIDLISKQDSIETNTIKIDSNTKIIATIVNAKGDPVEEGEAEIIFNFSGEGTLAEPLTKTTIDQQTSITLTASNTPGVATVTASANNLLPGTIAIYVTGPPESISVEVNPNHIYMGQTADVIVTLKDINGITVEAENDIYIDLLLSPDLGEFTDDSITIFSGYSSGSTTFTPTATGDSIIQATDTGLTAGEAAITIASALVADHIEVSASLASIEAGENTPSIITAVIKSAEPENATVTNYSKSITFTITSEIGCFSSVDSGSKEVTLTLTDDPDNYQDGVAWVELYSNSYDTSGNAIIIVNSGGLPEGNTEVGFYVEADHIELTPSKDSIDLFGVPDDTCTITAIIKDSDGITVGNYIEYVLFSIIEGEPTRGQFTTVGDTIVKAVNGEASIDLRGQCQAGDVVIHAVSTFGETQITSEPDETVTVTDGSGRSIELVSGSLQQPSKNEVVFEINNTGVVDLKIYNLQVTCGTSEKLTEIKINSNNVYSGSASDGDVVDITPTVLSQKVHEIYFGYTKKVDNNHFTIIFNADPDCDLFLPIEFDT